VLSFLTPALVLLSSFVTAQSTPVPPLAITPDLATQHLKSSPPPNYPGMSTPVHLSGAVKLSVSIDTAGQVTQVKWVEPHPSSESADPSSSNSLINMLSSYAIAAVKTWTYTPFNNDGVPVAVTTTVSVPFDFAARPSSSRPVPGYEETTPRRRSRLLPVKKRPTQPIRFRKMPSSVSPSTPLQLALSAGTISFMRLSSTQIKRLTRQGKGTTSA